MICTYSYKCYDIKQVWLISEFYLWLHLGSRQTKNYYTLVNRVNQSEILYRIFGTTSVDRLTFDQFG